jgi:hypothetical protein
MKNIAEQSSQKVVLESLRSRLKTWMQEQGDTGDSVYHKDKGRGRNYLDEIYLRKIRVNVLMTPTRTAGSLDDTVQVELSCSIWKAEIRYTLNGEQPTEKSQIYQHPFLIDSPVTIKARAFWAEGKTPIKEVQFEGVDFRFLYENTHHKPLYQ